MSLIEKRISDLTLVEIDCAIAMFLDTSTIMIHRHEGLACCKIAESPEHNSYPFRPSSEYKDGGGLAEYYKIASAWDPKKELWFAQCTVKEKEYVVSHKDWLASLMLAILRGYVGEVVRVPII